MVRPTSQSLFENCKQNFSQFKRLQSLSNITDSSGQSTIDILMQIKSLHIEELHPNLYRTAKTKRSQMIELFSMKKIQAKPKTAQ